MKKMVQSIAFRLSMPIPLFLLLCMAIAWVTVPRILENSTVDFVTKSATNAANQIKQIRGYYTRNVVVDVEAVEGLSVGVDHEDNPGVVPLPATFVHDISGLIADQDISLSLYSAFPFPGRRDRQMDGYMQEAWTYLNENPEGTFKRQEVVDGVTFLRVAVADRMVVDACVSCHNSHPDSPKSGWKLGDVRGVLEVRENIQAPLAASLDLTRNILIGVALAGLGLLLIVWGTTRTITRPITKICENMDVLAAGNMEGEISAASRGDELGQIGKTLVNLRNDLKSANDVAKESVDRMTALLGALPDNYFRIDQMGAILEYRVRPGFGPVNDPVAFLGCNLADILPPDPLLLFQENMRKQQDTQGVVSWEYTLEYEGERRDREAHLCPISGGEELVLVVRDISKRRQAERQRTLVEARLGRLISNLPGVVLSRKLSPAGESEVIYVSPQSEDIWGYTPEEIYTTKDILEGTLDPEDLITLRQLFVTSAEALKPYSHRYQITSRSGQRKWLETNSSAYMQDDGSTLTVGFISDVSAEVRTQEQLEGQRKIADRAQKLESIGQLTGGMAHDFNNLLAAIMGSLELLRDDETDPEHQALIDAGIRATQRGADLTRSMLAFARRASLDPSVIDLNALVNETCNWAGRTLPSSIDINTFLTVGLWPIKADISSTESAVLNLIVNARDAMREGGQLTIETSNIRIDEDYLDARQEKMEPGRYVMLAVSDTGHGIPDAALDKIFEPFFSTKALGAGTGLGLSMILGFMRQSGGMVQVYSEPDVGTTFKLYFKAFTDEVEATVTERVQKVSLTGDGQKILVAEDDKHVLPILVATLEKAGYGVTAARSGDEAFALFEADPTFDLLLTDIMMPGTLKGIALSRAVREKVADLPVIFMSGYSNEATVHGNGLRPEDIRLMKPVMRADLLTAIKETLIG
ncbi:ATP-binding protein [Parasedimentitalea maritima]|uniref:histidine kinase n=1 Tax=Parasedimentitalea maritima TaxID=2578117 RepID=A0A6A4RDR2_9RHOB|nr:ATP-binding protein [Zongyanglinia marina]KAE9628331.1 response regulator [Zongyanglinia marina]